MYTTDEFAEKIKEKYPQYKDIDNKSLVEKITTKYPQYKEQIHDNPLSSLSAPTEKVSTERTPKEEKQSEPSKYFNYQDPANYSAEQLKPVIERSLQESRNQPKLSALNKKLQANPNDAATWSELGDVHNQMGDKEGALSFYSKAASLKDAKALRGLGSLYQQAGQEKDAIKAYKEAVDVNPNDVFSAQNLAFIHNQKGEYKQAQEAIDKLKSSDPYNPYTHQLSAFNKHKAGEDNSSDIASYNFANWLQSARLPDTKGVEETEKERIAPYKAELDNLVQELNAPLDFAGKSELGVVEGIKEGLNSTYEAGKAMAVKPSIENALKVINGLGRTAFSGMMGAAPITNMAFQALPEDVQKVIFQPVDTYLQMLQIDPSKVTGASKEAKDLLNTIASIGAIGVAHGDKIIKPDPLRGYTEEQTKQIAESAKKATIADVEKVQDANNSIPKDIQGEARAKVLPLVVQRISLESQKVNDAFKSEHEAKIAEVDKQIQKELQDATQEGEIPKDDQQKHLQTQEGGLPAEAGRGDLSTQSGQEKEVIDQSVYQGAMSRLANEMVGIEGKFSQEGLRIETDYDNQIVIIDKNGDIVEPEDVPDHLKAEAQIYEDLTSKMGEFDNKTFQEELSKARGEETSYEDVTNEPVANLEVSKDIKQELPSAEKEQLKADMAAGKEIAPIIVNESGEVLDGNNRLETAKELGKEEIPVKRVPDGTTVEAAQKMTADSEAGEKTPLQEAKTTAEEHGFDHPSHLLNTIEKETGVTYENVQDVPSDALKSAARNRIIRLKEQYNALGKRGKRSAEGKSIDAKMQLIAKKLGYDINIAGKNGNVKITEKVNGRDKLVEGPRAKRTKEAIEQANKDRAERKKQLNKQPESLAQWVYQKLLQGMKISKSQLIEYGKGETEIPFTLRRVINENGLSFHDIWEQAREEVPGFTNEDNYLFNNELADILDELGDYGDIYKKLSGVDDEYNAEFHKMASAWGIDPDKIMEEDELAAAEAVDKMTDEEARQLLSSIPDDATLAQIHQIEEQYGLNAEKSTEGKTDNDVRQKENVGRGATEKIGEAKPEEVKEPTTSAAKEQPKELTAKEKAKQDLDEKLKAFRKKGGLSMGGFENLPEFVDVVRAAIKYGIESAKDFVKYFKEKNPELEIDEKKLEDKFNEIKGVKTSGVSQEAMEKKAEELGIKAPERGEKIPTEASIERGRGLIRAGADPEKIVSDFDKTKDISVDKMSVVRAHIEALTNSAHEAADKFGTDSKEYKEAAKSLEDFMKRSKPMATEWSNIGESMKGELEINPDSFASVDAAFRDMHGREMTPDETKSAKKIVEENKDNTDEINKLLKELGKLKEENAKLKEAGKKEKYDRKGLAKDIRKLKTKPFTFTDENGNVIEVHKMGATWNDIVETAAKIVENGGAIADAIAKVVEVVKDADWYKSLSDKDKKRFEDSLQKQLEGNVPEQTLAEKYANKKDMNFSPDEAKEIWKYATENYIDKGVPFERMVRGVMGDLGLTRAQVIKALASTKQERKIVDEIWKRDQKRSAAKRKAKEFIDAANRSPIQKLFKILPDAFFAGKVLGHGTVGFVTHAGTNIFQPSTWKTYFPLWIKSFKMAYGDSMDYAHLMETFENQKDYGFWKRAGLAIEPSKPYDDYQMVSKYTGRIGAAGDRGFNALKLLRFELAKHYYDGLSDAAKADPNTAKMIAELVNHGTGSAALRMPSATNKVFFAPRLEAARWANLITDPIKAASTFSKWNRASIAEKTAAKITARRYGEIAGVMLGMMAANKALNQLAGSKEEVNMTHPTRNDFMRFKIGGQVIDPSGGIMSLVNFVARMADVAISEQRVYQGKPQSRWDRSKSATGDYLRGKLSPFAAFTLDHMVQSAYDGRPLPWSKDIPQSGKDKQGYVEYYGEQMLPIPFSEGLREFVEGMKEQGATKSQTQEALKAMLVTGLVGTTGVKVRKDKSNEEDFYEMQSHLELLKLQHNRGDITDSQFKSRSKEILDSKEWKEAQKEAYTARREKKRTKLKRNNWYEK